MFDRSPTRGAHRARPGAARPSDGRPPGVRRRVFLKGGAVALLALGMPPGFLLRAATAGTGGGRRRKTIVFVFQRGAVDGLNMVVPFGDPAYYRSRRGISVPAPAGGRDGTALDLDGFFGLHPALGPLHELWDRGELGAVHAVGSPHPSRSHFDAQDFMETATPGVKTTPDGWLNRLLDETDPCCGRTLADPGAHASDHSVGQADLAAGASPLRGVALSADLPRALRGPYGTVALGDLARFGIAGGDHPLLESAFERLYADAGGEMLGDASEDSFEVIDFLRRMDPLRYAPAAGIEYPATEFGRSLRQIAQLIKADAGVEVAFADIGGWDTHVAQGGAEGRLADRLRELARGLRAFHDDLGDRMEDVVVVSMSEFGRTVAENGSGGTDHGHGNCMIVLGGSVRGGRVLGRWPGLEREQLYEKRDLAVTTDFRDVFAEVATGHLGIADPTGLATVFPGHGIEPGRWVGILRQSASRG